MSLTLNIAYDSFSLTYVMPTMVSREIGELYAECVYALGFPTTVTLTGPARTITFTRQHLAMMSFIGTPYAAVAASAFTMLLPKVPA